MIKYLFVIAVLLGAFVLLMPAKSEAAITYSRTPTGDTVSGPVAITVSADSFSDFSQCGFAQNPQYWDIEINSIEGTFTAGPVFASTTLSVIVPFNLPSGNYVQVMVAVSETANVFVDACSVTNLEINSDGSPIFTVVQPPGGGDEISGPTRSAGFWQNHTDFVIALMGSSQLGAFTVGQGTALKTVGAPEILGAYISKISRTTTDQKRSNLEQTRMQLLEQLITAKLNCTAFTCSSSGALAFISDADSAYSFTDIDAMKILAGQLENFNTSGEALPLPSWFGPAGTATPQTSRAVANVSFWDTP